ncbi:Transposon Tf2-2 polyprotein [Vitis vinifera]|uniref:Transposon Tf2-2 polyprotein n=1 Tax=Vitis vinifera TaxID=29760 RepID=A0A438FQY9_VITVI|nr:Transposon Tf2-2 polyprotein [Vitis vinifera]
MPMPRTEKEIRGFLGRLQYISRFIARLTDVCEPIFRLLRKNQPTVWNDGCQIAFEKINEYFLSPPILVPPMPGRPLLLYLSVSDMALGCMLAQLDDSGKERAIYYLSKRMLEYEMRYVMIERMCLALVWATRRLRHYMTEYSIDEMARTPDRVDIQYVSQKSIKGSIVADHLASLPISESRPVDDDFPDEEFIAMTSLSGWRMYFDGTANQSGYGIGVSIVEYEACILGLETALELDIRQMKELLVTRFDDLRYVHLPRAQNRFADALATLASSVDIPIDVVIRPLLIELRSSLADRVMREVHAGVCGPHMGGHMLARKIMRTGYFWLTMETDCCQFVQKCPECQIHGDLIHAPPSELHALTSPWPFSVWGIDIIGKVSPKSSSGHEFILVAIDYFTKWVEAASYARGALRAEVDTLLQKYAIRHHRSSAYRPQTNGAVEAANKNIKRILRKMVETSRDWSEKLPFALWAYRTSFRTSTGATPYSLVYGMEAVLPIETEMGSLRVALEQQISETEWAQARFDQLNLLDERRLRAADHVQAYQRKMARAFKKRVKPRPLQKGDLVLRILRGLIETLEESLDLVGVGLMLSES